MGNELVIQQRSIGLTQRIVNTDYDRKNVICHLFLYSMAGILLGIYLDLLPTYLYYYKDTQQLGELLSVFIGIGSIIGALITLQIDKLGFKRIFMISIILSFFALSGLYFTTNLLLLSVVVSGYGIATIIFSSSAISFLDTYTTNSPNKHKWFSMLYLFNSLGICTGSFAGGSFVVFLLSLRENLSYLDAKNLSRQIDLMTASQLQNYLDSYRTVFLYSIIVVLLILIPYFLIKETRHVKVSKINYKNNLRDILENKPALSFLVSSIVMVFGAATLFSYLSIFFSQLQIDRQAVSLVMTINALIPAMVMYFIPFIIKRVGLINTRLWVYYVGSFFLLVAAILIWSNAYNYLIIGIILSANAFLIGAKGCQSQIMMEVVSEKSRVTISSIYFILIGFAQVLSGVVSRSIIFKTSQPFMFALIFSSLSLILGNLIISKNIRESNLRN